MYICGTRRYVDFCYLCLALLFFCAFGGFAPFSPAHGQPVETYPVQLGERPEATQLPQSSVSISADDTSLGVNLSALIIVDKGIYDGVTTHAAQGVDTEYASSHLQSAAFKKRMQAFVGVAISSRLISEIRATIVQYFREIDRPLVSVTIPPQEITAGRLQLDVRRFTVGAVVTEGNKWTPQDHIVSRVRVKSGDEFISSEVSEDIDWLNLNPYRRIAAVLQPGAEIGTTDLILRSNEQKPLTANAGYSNTGPDSDSHRFFAGFSAANFPLIDHLIGYQFTSSASALRNGLLFSLNKTPGYISHSGTYFAPLDWGNGNRGKLKLQASHVENFSELRPPLTQQNRTAQLSGEYAVPIKLRVLKETEAFAGFDLRRQQNDVFFANIPASSSTQDIVHFELGIRGDFETFLNKEMPGLGNFDFRVVWSPGGLTGFNTDTNFAQIANDPAVTANYAYVSARISHQQKLVQDISLNTRFAMQLTTHSLPDIVQFSIGGAGSVRGFATNEADGNFGFWAINEVMLPAFAPRSEFVLLPFGFLDIGVVADQLADTPTTLIGTGAGTNIQFNGNANLSLTGALALTDGPKTSIGDWRLHLRFSANY